MTDPFKPFERAAAALTAAAMCAADAGRADFEAQLAKLRADAASMIVCPPDPDSGMNAMGLRGTVTVRAKPGLRDGHVLSVGTAVVAEAARFEDALTYGWAAGLSDEQSREVVTVWQDYHRARLNALDWDIVKRSMVLRAIGEDWRP